MRYAGDTADAEGIDGSEDNAGAVLGSDSYGFFGEPALTSPTWRSFEPNR